MPLAQLLEVHRHLEHACFIQLRLQQPQAFAGEWQSVGQHSIGSRCEHWQWGCDAGVACGLSSVGVGAAVPPEVQGGSRFGAGDKTLTYLPSHCSVPYGNPQIYANSFAGVGPRRLLGHVRPRTGFRQGCQDPSYPLLIHLHKPAEWLPKWHNTRK